MRQLLTALLLFTASIAQAELAVVVSIDSPVQQLAGNEVAKIFLAKTNRLSDGNRVKPVELTDAQVRAQFYRKISGKTLPQIRSYWTTLIFTGKGRPPKAVKKASRLVEALNRDPYAIGYLPMDLVTDSVKVVHTFN